MLDFSQFRVITFDCYGTLIDWESGILGALRPILIAHGVQLDDAEILRLYGDFEHEAEADKYIPYREVLREVVRGFGKQLGFEPNAAEQNALPESLVNWEPFPDSVAALRKIKSRLQVGIISNIDEAMFATTKPKLGMDFKYVTTAGQARAYKPSLAIFELAESKMSIQRHEWLHAGQSIYHDVIPAKSLGLAMVWVNRPSRRPGVGAVRQAAGQPDLEVHSLAELAGLMESLTPGLP
jgi:2-haloacid dehalogenase